jgi:hypothetical protein
VDPPFAVNASWQFARKRTILIRPSAAAESAGGASPERSFVDLERFRENPDHSASPVLASAAKQSRAAHLDPNVADPWIASLGSQRRWSR